MAENENVFVLIPSFNEASVIRDTVSPLIEKGYRVVVVDDYSTDNTKQILQGIDLVYLRHELNLGQGAAIQTGISYAYENGAEYAVTFDADGQHNPEEIEVLLTPLKKGECDITLGTRFKRNEDIVKVPFARRLLLKGAIIINGLFTGMWLTDAHNGFRAMNKNALQKIKLTENRMSHATEILSIIQKEKLRYCEVPVSIVYTDYSKTKGQSSLNSINILIDLVIKKLMP